MMCDLLEIGKCGIGNEVERSEALHVTLRKVYDEERNKEAIVKK
jgi:hypothetical protein